MADVEREGWLLANPLGAAAFEQLIILGLLQSHPHNCSAALQTPKPPVANSALLSRIR
jgi:hypothetical protein